MQKDTNNNEIRFPALLGLNERVSKGATPIGEWNELEGMYPGKAGLLERILGKTQYEKLAGEAIWQIHQTNDGTGNILVQTESRLLVYTLDELRDRSYSPSLTYTSLSEEETMSMAIIVQMEANNTNGGSAQGKQTSAESGGGAAAANTFYGRRLTHMLFNEGSIVDTFTASTGGGAANSTEGTFTLPPGTYRIRGYVTFNGLTGGQTVVCGLYNTTVPRFEYARTTGGAGTDPILFTLTRDAASNNNSRAIVDSGFIVESTNKTFAIRHAATDATWARQHTFCGTYDSTSSITVNSAAPPHYYAYITIIKTA